MTTPSPAHSAGSAVFLQASGITVHHVIKDDSFMTLLVLHRPARY